MDFGQAVKCLQRMRPRRMSPETPLTPGQAKLKDAASKMDFAEVHFSLPLSILLAPPSVRFAAAQEDILLALRQVDGTEGADETAFKRSKLQVRPRCLSVVGWRPASVRPRVRRCWSG